MPSPERRAYAKHGNCQACRSYRSYRAKQTPEAYQNDKISKIEGVNSTQTSFLLEHIKDSYEWGTGLSRLTKKRANEK